MALKDKLMTLEDFKAVRDVDVASNSAQFTEIKADLGTQSANILESLGNSSPQWRIGKSYNLTSTYTNVATDAYIDTNNYACCSVNCTPNDTFYLTGTGGSGSKLWAWTDASNNIISRAASNLAYNDEKMIAPANAAHLLVNIQTANPYKLLVGEKTKNVLSTALKYKSVSVSTDSILSIPNDSFCMFSDIQSVSDIGDFPALSSYGNVGVLIFKYTAGVGAGRKTLMAVIPSVGKVVFGTISPSNVISWNVNLITKQEINKKYYPIAYLSSGGEFTYTTDEVGSFTLGADIIVVVGGALNTITRASVVSAANAVNFVTVDGYTFSGQSFALVFNTDTNSPEFVVASTAGYLSANSHPTLFYHRYTSNTSGLLVDYANRQKIAESNAKLPSYFETEAVTCRDGIELATEEKSYVIAFLTDTHYPVGNNWKSTAQTLKRVNELVPFDAIIHGGDIVHGNVEASLTKRDLRKLRDDLLGISDNLFMLSGNHDDNLIYYNNNNSGFITRGERYSIYGRFSDSDGRLGTYTCLYYDVPDMGLRVILLDSMLDDSVYTGGGASWGFTNEVVSWVSNVALDTNNQVVFFSHVPCTAEFDFGTSSGGASVYNGDAIKAAINAFVQNGGTVVGFFHGHTHWDNIAKASDADFYEVCTGTARYDTKTSADWDYVAQGATIPARAFGTVTQELWDTIVIQPDARTVKMIRFGAGSDRQFTY